MSDTLQYSEPFNFADLGYIQLFEITVCIYKMCLLVIYLIYM